MLTLSFLYKLALILICDDASAPTVDNIAIYCSITQLVIYFMVWPADPTKFWSLTVVGDFFLLCLPKLIDW